MRTLNGKPHIVCQVVSREKHITPFLTKIKTKSGAKNSCII